MKTSALEYFNSDLMAANVELQEQVRKLECRCQSLEQNNLFLKEKYALLRQQAYGKSSEKRQPVVGKESLLLPGFDAPTTQSTAPEAVKETISYERTKPKRTTGLPVERSSRFPAHLRRVSTDLPSVECQCPKCGKGMEHVINIEITEKLCCSRDPFYVQEYRRPVLGCQSCEQIAPVTQIPEVFERTGVDQTVVAYLLVNKFRYSLPLYRQGQMFRDIGIKYSNDGLLDWGGKGLDLLQPVYAALLRLVKSSQYLMADDTRLKAAVGPVANSQPSYKQGALWGLYAVHHVAPMVAYEFTNKRSHEACREVLKGFTGCLIVDGYDGFENIATPEGVRLAHCNNHARRTFIRAEGSDRERAREAVLFYQELYKIEEAGADLSPDDRTLLRQKEAVPIFKKFREWLEKMLPSVPRKSPLGKALKYVLSRWETLTLYTTDGRIPIDTNDLERAFRVVAVGRKNFMHAASEVGAHGTAIGYSLVNTCLLQGIDPFIYISDVLERVGRCTQNEVDNLLPHNWKKLYMAEATARYQAPPLPEGAKIDADSDSEDEQD